MQIHFSIVSPPNTMSPPSFDRTRWITGTVIIKASIKLQGTERWDVNSLELLTEVVMVLKLLELLSCGWMSPSPCKADDYNICTCNVYVLTDTELGHGEHHQQTENDRIINSSYSTEGWWHRHSLRHLCHIWKHFPQSFLRYRIHAPGTDVRSQWPLTCQHHNLLSSFTSIEVRVHAKSEGLPLRCSRGFISTKNGTDRRLRGESVQLNRGVKCMKVTCI